MAQIFLSYSSKDVTKAELLATVLARHGWSVWWDRQIPPGKSFDEVIEQALDAAQCVIVLWSSSSVSSNWVKGEAAEGARRRVLVPVVLEDVKIPLEFRRIETANLCTWNDKRPSPEFDVLLRAISSLIDGTTHEQLKESKPRSEPPSFSENVNRHVPDKVPRGASLDSDSTNLLPSSRAGNLAAGAILGLIGGGAIVLAWARVSQPIPWAVVFGSPILGSVLGILVGAARYASRNRTQQD